MRFTNKIRLPPACQRFNLHFMETAIYPPCQTRPLIPFDLPKTGTIGCQSRIQQRYIRASIHFLWGNSQLCTTDPKWKLIVQLNQTTQKEHQHNSRHGLILGVPKSVPARTDFEKFVRIFPLLTRAIAWDSSVKCQFYVWMFSTRTRPFKFLL